MTAKTTEGTMHVKARVDYLLCQGHTICAMIAPTVFELNDIDGTASAITGVVTSDDEAAVRDAAQSCPEQAIILTETLE